MAPAISQRGQKPAGAPIGMGSPQSGHFSFVRHTDLKKLTHWPSRKLRTDQSKTCPAKVPKRRWLRSCSTEETPKESCKEKSWPHQGSEQIAQFLVYLIGRCNRIRYDLSQNLTVSQA